LGLKLYQPVEKTREWVETHYYHVPMQQNSPQLVPWSRFWIDFARYGKRQDFLSPHIVEAGQTATSAMMALAVTDLPFKAEKHEMSFDGGRMEIKAASPMIAFHEQLEPAELADAESPILVNQVFFDVDESDTEAAVIRDTELLFGVAYGCRVVLSNPTNKSRALQVLLQIPRGALPLSGTRATEGRRIVLPAYATQSMEYHFYFPEVGKFPHFPAHVSERQKLVAFAKPLTIEVVRQRTKVDRGSWTDVARNGTDDEVLSFLQTHSLEKVNLELVAHRLKQRAFYDRLTELLSKRHAYHHTVWSYSLYHDDPTRIGVYLEHATAFARSCGMALKSPLLRLDPVKRMEYEHVEFRPLINPRAHPLGGQRQITNARLQQQYQTFLDWLCQVRQLNHAQRIELTYFLLVQDRIEDALEHFTQVDPEQLTSRLQYDYCAAYLAFFQAEPEPARAIAEKYVDYPVNRWRERFQAVIAQLDEIDGAKAKVVDDESRAQRQTAAADRQPVVDLKIEGTNIKIEYRNLKSVVVNYYPMDIELLFSRKPFIQQFGDRFAQVKPNRSDPVDLPDDQVLKTLAIPEELRNKNVLVEVVGDSVSRSEVRFANALRVELAETQGMLRVVDDQRLRPIPRTYIKVYARLKDGRVTFYKDGYTDLRGRFDYASLSTDKLDHVQRFAILVLSDEYGAVIREADVPKR